MAYQTYASHAHRPAPTALAFVLAVTAVTGFVMHWRDPGSQWTFRLGLAALTAAVFVLVYISRLYTTRLQDRIIRLEMRVRCASFLTPAQQSALMSLDLRRIAAMRFADDAEIPALLERTVRDSLTPDQIKRAVTNWMPDTNRT